MMYEKCKHLIEVNIIRLTRTILNMN